MSEEQKKELVIRATDLGQVVFNIKSAFLVWRQLSFSINSTITDQEFAGKSVEIINFHGGFFIPVILSLEHYFNVELYTLLVKVREKSVPGLVKSLKAAGFDHVADYEDFKKKYEKEIDQIKECRDKILAHKDRNVNSKELLLPSINSYEDLIEDLEELFNKITSESLDHSFWWFEDTSSEAFRDTNLVMANLLRGEAMRRAEIDADMRDKLIENYSIRKKSAPKNNPDAKD